MAEEKKPRKPRRPKRELTARQQEFVEKRAKEGAAYSTIAKELDEAAYGTDGWQPLYDAVRRTAIERLGGQEQAIAAKKAGREKPKDAS